MWACHGVLLHRHEILAVEPIYYTKSFTLLNRSQAIQPYKEAVIFKENLRFYGE